MIEQHDVSSTVLVFVHENVSRMRIGMNVAENEKLFHLLRHEIRHRNSPIEENHVWVQNSQLVADIEWVDFILFDVFEVIDLPTFAVLHHQHPVRRQLPVNLRNFQPLNSLEMRSDLKAETTV